MIGTEVWEIYLTIIFAIMKTISYVVAKLHKQSNAPKKEAFSCTFKIYISKLATKFSGLKVLKFCSFHRTKLRLFVLLA